MAGEEGAGRAECGAREGEEGDWFVVKGERSEAVWALAPNGRVVARHPRAAAAAAPTTVEPVCR